MFFTVKVYARYLCDWVGAPEDEKGILPGPPYAIWATIDVKMYNTSDSEDAKCVWNTYEQIVTRKIGEHLEGENIMLDNLGRYRPV